MNTRLPGLVEAFKGLRVLVLGDAMLDSYLEGATERLCREAPVPIVGVEQRKDAPGGAANTAVNVRSLGAEVRFLSVVGDDAEAALLRSALERQGVGTEHLLVDPDRRTLTKTRVVASSQLLVRFDQGTSGPVDELAERLLISRLAELFAFCDTVIVSDYGHGVLTPGVVGALRAMQASRERLLTVDCKNPARYREVGVAAVKPNYAEAVRLLGMESVNNSGDRAIQMAGEASRILDLTGSRLAAVTLDADGAIVFERGEEPYRTYAQPSANSRASGAGDTFLAALTLALAAGAATPEAAELASAAAAVVVARDGTVACRAEELLEQIGGGGKYAPSVPALVRRIEPLRLQGQRVVFTNGCFDLLHPGHISFLNRAKALGEVLVVGLNSDRGVARLKGPGRPILSLAERVQLLSALSSVDHIVAFDEDTPEALILAIRPDVFVKGGGYSRDMLPEAGAVERLGGSIHLLPYLEERSTRDIIQQIVSGSEYGHRGALAASP